MPERKGLHFNPLYFCGPGGAS
jgi:hypothetical protein